MHRGIELGLFLTPGLPNEGFVAEALGNLAAFALQRERQETLAWQVLRVEGTGAHHFRLIVRHPDRPLDVGFRKGLEGQLDTLSRCSVDELHRRLVEAKAEGLRPTPLRHVRDVVDFWQDDFWNWLG